MNIRYRSTVSKTSGDIDCWKRKFIVPCLYLTPPVRML